MSAENQENKDLVDIQDELNAENQSSLQEEQPANIADVESRLTEANDKYLRLCAEFDNYRRRTVKEKIDLIKNASEEVIKGMLPILDDLDRSIEAMDKTDSVAAVVEGVKLIQSKLISYLSSKGLSEIQAQGLDLDTDLHDAITTIPAPEESLKKKIVDVVQKGYKLNDKVIRHSKVVVGE